MATCIRALSMSFLKLDLRVLLISFKRLAFSGHSLLTGITAAISAKFRTSVIEQFVNEPFGGSHVLNISLILNFNDVHCVLSLTSLTILESTLEYKK